jgi:hypothetical protein
MAPRRYTILLWIKNAPPTIFTLIVTAISAAARAECAAPAGKGNAGDRLNERADAVIRNLKKTHTAKWPPSPPKSHMHRLPLSASLSGGPLSFPALPYRTIPRKRRCLQPWLGVEYSQGGFAVSAKKQSPA